MQTHVIQKHLEEDNELSWFTESLFKRFGLLNLIRHSAWNAGIFIFLRAGVGIPLFVGLLYACFG
jgi:hypothetical protein